MAMMETSNTSPMGDQKSICRVRLIAYPVFLCFILFLAIPSVAQTFFTDVTEEMGETAFNAFGLTSGDYNNDGRPDLFIAETGGDPGTGKRIGLLQNEGDGRFANHTLAIQADIPDVAKGGGTIFGDYDNDGDLDLCWTGNWKALAEWKRSI